MSYRRAFLCGLGVLPTFLIQDLMLLATLSLLFLGTAIDIAKVERPRRVLAPWGIIAVPVSAGLTSGLKIWPWPLASLLLILLGLAGLRWKKIFGPLLRLCTIASLALWFLILPSLRPLLLAAFLLFLASIPLNIKRVEGPAHLVEVLSLYFILASALIGT